MVFRVFYEASRNLDSRPPSRNQPRRSLSSPRVYVCFESSGAAARTAARRCGAQHKTDAAPSQFEGPVLRAVKPLGAGRRGLTPRWPRSLSSPVPRLGGNLDLARSAVKGPCAGPPRTLREKSPREDRRDPDGPNGLPRGRRRRRCKTAATLRKPLASLRKWSGWTTQDLTIPTAPSAPAVARAAQTYPTPSPWPRPAEGAHALPALPPTSGERPEEAFGAPRRGPAAASAGGSAASPPRSWRRWPSSGPPSKA